MPVKNIQFANGETIEYSTIFKEYYKALVLYANKYISCREESESLIQSVFLVLWERENNFANEGKLRKYLYTTARNKSLNHLREKHALTNYQKSLLNGELVEEERAFFIEEETFRLLLHEVNRLHVNQREIILLALNNHNNHEIADLLNISVNTVKFHKKNAYKILRSKLADHYFIFFLFFTTHFSSHGV